MSAKSEQILIPEQLPICERQLLAEIANGKQDKEISVIGAKGKKLSSKGTIYYRTKLQSRVDLHSPAELTKLAFRLGLTKIDV